MTSRLKTERGATLHKTNISLQSSFKVMHKYYTTVCSSFFPPASKEGRANKRQQLYLGHGRINASVQATTTLKTRGLGSPTASPPLSNTKPLHAS